MGKRAQDRRASAKGWNQEGVQLLKKEERGQEVGKINSIVGSETKFNGDCRVEGTIRVDGEFEGKLEVSKVIIIGKSGVVKGEVKSSEVVVGGRVMGTIQGENRVELQAGAHVEGDIRTKSLIVDEGVFFDGQCKMKDDRVKDLKVIDTEGIDSRKANN